MASKLSILVEQVKLIQCAVLIALASTPSLALQNHPSNDVRLLDELTALEIEHDTLRPPANVGEAATTRIVALTTELSPSMVGVVDGTAVVRTLNGFIFEHLGIEASHETKDPEDLFLSSVLARKQGYCVGIAALYLVLAERLGLPVFAVATPSHVFLRYDDGATRINIETFQNGANVPDEEYVREQKIPEVSIRKKVFLRNLTTAQFLAQVHNNLGVIYSEQKRYTGAAAQYERALELYLKFPAALYNYGNDLLQQGELPRAVRLFSKSLRLYPTDVWALNNRGLAYLKLGKREKARRDFEEAIRIDPGFETARKNLAALDP